MKKIISIFIFCFIAESQAQTVLYEQNFDSLTVGVTLMNQITTGEWETWDNTMGGNNDPFISSEQSNSNNNSLKIIPGKDVIYKFGNLKNGHYQVDFDLYIPSGKNVYNNIQHEQGKNWVNEIMCFTDTVYYYDWNEAGTNKVYTPMGNYNSDSWNHMTYDFDFDNETLTYLVNSDTMYSTTIYTTRNNRPSINLDVINFYGINASTEYYIDDFKVSAWKEHGNVTLETPSLVDFENIASGDITLTNTNQGNVKYEAHILFDHHSVFDQGPLIQKSFEAHDSAIFTNGRYFQTTENVSYEEFTAFEMDEFIGLTLDSIRPYAYPVTDTIGDCYFVLGDPNSTIDPMSFDDILYSKTIDPNKHYQTIYEIGDYIYNGGGFYPGIQANDYDTFYVGLHKNEDYNFIQNYDNDAQFHPGLRMNFDLYFSGQLWPKWLEINNPIGIIDSGQSLDLELEFDLSQLEINNQYTANINIISNDDSLGIQAIPVSLDYNNISLDEDEIQVGVLTYPNPTTDLVYLQANKEMKSVEIYNLQGKNVQVASVNNFETQIDLSSYAKGQYIMIINFIGGQMQKSIIKQ